MATDYKFRCEGAEAKLVGEVSRGDVQAAATVWGLSTLLMASGLS